jgi:hypothetical protein
MKLPEDGPKCGPKHVAVIKYNQCKQLDWLFFIVVLTARISQIMMHNRMQTVEIHTSSFKPGDRGDVNKEQGVINI